MAVASLLPATNGNQGPAVRPQRGTWIYFLNVDNERRIKIGHSTKGAFKRSQQHARNVTGDTIPLEILCQVRGMVSDEKAVQRFFSADAVPGNREVFEPTERLIDYIRWLREQYFVGMPDMTDAELEALPIVPADAWLPEPERRKPVPTGVLPIMLGAFNLGQRDVTGDDFYTDESIVDAARNVMGRIDTDPASHAVANRVVQATRIYTRDDNGLQRPWNGRVWINPPFSEKGVWADKALTEWRSGRATEICFLQQTRALTAQYFTPLLRASDAICIFDGRIRFWGPKAADPNDGHFVLYLGPHRDAFLREFSPLGTVFYLPGKP